jgi:hypothetical protein
MDDNSPRGQKQFKNRGILTVVSGLFARNQHRFEASRRQNHYRLRGTAPRWLRASGLHHLPVYFFQIVVGNLMNYK